MTILISFLLIYFPNFVKLILIQLELISIFKVDEGLVLIKKSAKL